MKIKGLFTSLFVVAGLVMAVGSVSADTAQQRIHKQHMRIREGVKSGALTPQEARRLRQHERRIQRAVHRAHVNGVTPAEKAKLQHRLNLQSKRIYRLKHNGKTSPKPL